MSCSVVETLWTFTFFLFLLPDKFRGRGGSQLPECPPRAMRSPPPLRRASLQLIAPASAKLLPASLAPTPPLSLDAADSGLSFSLCDNQTLQADGRSGSCVKT